MNLTIITAIYNNYDGLMNILECLDNQTYQNFEHILVDDCSTEISYNQLVELCKNNKRRHFVKLGTRCHYYGAIARNIGAMMAFSYLHASKRNIENEWVCFLDTDNLWEPNHLELMIEILNANPQATMIASDAVWIGANDKSFRETRQCKIKHGSCDLGQFLYKTKLFREFGYFFPHPRRKHKYDWELIKKMTEGEGDKLVFTNKPTFLMNYKKR